MIIFSALVIFSPLKCRAPASRNLFRKLLIKFNIVNDYCLSIYSGFKHHKPTSFYLSAFSVCILAGIISDSLNIKLIISVNNIVSLQRRNIQTITIKYKTFFFFKTLTNLVSCVYLSKLIFSILVLKNNKFLIDQLLL